MSQEHHVHTYIHLNFKDRKDRHTFAGLNSLSRKAVYIATSEAREFFGVKLTAGSISRGYFSRLVDMTTSFATNLAKVYQEEKQGPYEAELELTEFLIQSYSRSEEFSKWVHLPRLFGTRAVICFTNPSETPNPTS